ncbi:MAG: hypothetical protein WAM94_17515 [Chromatiaceae bacterium]
MLRWEQADRECATALLARFGIGVSELPPDARIPGTYWGEPEAGLIGNRLYLRSDTPLHSALHEACHYVCMDPTRRAALDTDAGGDYAEEDAVCYLQILLADKIPGFGQAQMTADMDAWGYTFRLGTARAWFEQDAQNARDWLIRHGVLGRDGRLTWSLRLA